MDEKLDDYIPAVPREALARTITDCKENPGTCKRDPGSEALFVAEHAFVKKWRCRRGDDEQEADRQDNLVGLALSGGGIRSATFSLGILQAFVNHDLLKKVDYLSTVSGGGYIGSSVTWLTSELGQSKNTDAEPKNFDVNQGGFPYGSDDPRPEKPQRATPKQERMLKYLREHGYYLTPGAGISTFSLLGAILRGMFLSLMVWIPVFILTFLVLLWVPTLFSDDTESVKPLLYGHLLDKLAPAITLPALDEAEQRNAASWTGYEGAWVLSPPAVEEVRDQLAARAPFADVISPSKGSRLILFEIILLLGLVVLTVLVASAVAYSVLTWFSRGTRPETRENWYKWRRTVDKFAAVLFPVAFVAILIGILPLAGTMLDTWLAGSGPLAAVAGAAMALRDFLAPGSRKEGTAPSALAGIGAGLFLYGVLVSCYMAAQLLIGWVDSVGQVILIMLPFLALAWFVNLNYVSIHRYYRDRLMETFMPDIGDAQDQRTGCAPGANGATLHAISNREAPHGPYHIVNSNVVLVSSKDPVYRSRGGDSFILSPLYCGSNATGWRRTANYMRGRITLATAVAVSGAAANPNTGVGGVGLTRNLFVSLVMSLLNLRLGYWADHPDPKYRFRHPPNHFRPGAYALGYAMGIQDRGYNENRGFVQLSDGGHFENMGLYELIRRRVKLAIVADGSGDREFSFSDMQTTVRRIEDDFGARIKILEPDLPDLVVPDVPQPPCYPPNAGLAKQGHMLGSITYADGSRGWLIFVKTTLIDDVSFKVKGYVAQHPDFPDETTADQFFDEVQFESYRELGYCIADKMLGSRVNTDQGEIGLAELVSNCGAHVPLVS